MVRSSRDLGRSQSQREESPHNHECRRTMPRQATARTTRHHPLLPRGNSLLPVSWPSRPRLPLRPPTLAPKHQLTSELYRVRPEQSNLNLAITANNRQSLDSPQAPARPATFADSGLGGSSARAVGQTLSGRSVSAPGARARVPAIRHTRTEVRAQSDAGIAGAALCPRMPHAGPEADG